MNSKDKGKGKSILCRCVLIEKVPFWVTYGNLILLVQYNENKNWYTIMDVHSKYYSININYTHIGKHIFRVGATKIKLSEIIT